MHKDTKIGLATGILILGIAGAFCFRKAESVPPTPLELKTKGTINHQLARKSLRPYLDDDSLPVRVTPDRNADWSLSDKDVSYAGDIPAPNPIISYADDVKQNRPSVTGIAAGKTTDNNSPQDSQKNPATTERLPIKTVSVQENEQKTNHRARLHEVKSGDTLSGISLKYFGTVKYYGRIYAANKDLLSSPNALIPGMKIRIPARDAIESPPKNSVDKSKTSQESTAEVIASKSDDNQSNEKPTAQKQPADSKTDIAKSSDEKKKLFKPATKGPFFTRPQTASANKDDPGETNQN